MKTLLDFTPCDELNDVGGCMIRESCNKITQGDRADAGCFIPIIEKKTRGHCKPGIPQYQQTNYTGKHEQTPKEKAARQRQGKNNEC